MLSNCSVLSYYGHLLKRLYFPATIFPRSYLPATNFPPFDFYRPLYSKIYVERARHEAPSTTIQKRKAVVVWVSPVAVMRQ